MPTKLSDQLNPVTMKSKVRLARLMLVMSAVFASLAVATPWAKAAYDVGDSSDRANLPIHFIDTTLILQGCPRGSALGDDPSLDRWIWAGRASFVVQNGLWIGFITEIIRRRRWREAAVWGFGLLVLLMALLLKPTIECLYVQFPPQLSLVRPWRLEFLAALFSLAGLTTAMWANVAVRTAENRKTD